MAVRIESRAEPLPGYRLIERLGGGGFGEVWKCEAPGGLHKAIKFVFGDLQAADAEGARAEQELKALKRVLTVRHPYILSLDRVDIIDGQLMIVMELADRTLWDRFRECRSQGLPGIPREELLGYMAETAEALDLMNSEEHKLQHLDIKPQNLFLVHNHVKVADFGLVKDLEGMMASVTGGVTPVYAAPETFDGYVSRFSDQYSLAIVYQELLTGQRPFTGTSIRQLVLQHLQAVPDVSSLPAADRVFINRALSKKPEDRFPTCAAMVEALSEADQTGPASPAPALPEPPRVTPPPTPRVREAGRSEADDADKTHGSPGNRNGSARARDQKRDSGVRADTPVLAAAPVTPPPVQPLSAGSSGPSDKVPARGTASPAAPADHSARSHPPATELKGDGLLRPALVVGLGHQGLEILRRLRRELFEQFGSHDILPHVRLLYLDTDPDALQTAAAGSADVALRHSEVLVAKLHRPSHYLKPGDGQQRLTSWFNPKLLYQMPRSQTSAGLRPLGRLAFVDNYRHIARRLQSELEACSTAELLTLAAKRTGLGVRSNTPRVYVAASLAGGTGGGMFLDVAYTLRHLLRRLGHDRAEIVGLFLVPKAERGMSPTPGLANTFAALTELNHFGAPDTVFQARYDTSDPQAATAVSEGGPPFQRCVFLPLPERRGASGWQPGTNGGDSIAEATSSGPVGLAGHLLLMELATPVGLAAEQARMPTPTGPICQTFGVYRLLWPRRQLVEQAARELCRRLVKRWMSKDAKPLREGVQQWVEAQWTDQGLSADQLILRLQEDCEKTMGQAPETLIAAIVAPLAERSGAGAAENALKQSAVIEAMEQLEHLVGVPDDCRPSGPTLSEPPPLSTVEQAVGQAVATVAGECEQRLAELLVRLIEEPAFRLAGAEEAIRQFNAAVEKALQHQEHLGKELQARAVVLYQRLHALLENPDRSPSANTLWKTPFNRRAASEKAALVNELLGLLRSYPKCRYQSLILHHLTGLYVSLRGLLSEQMREIGFCRQRLSELNDLFGEGGGANDLVPAAGRCLFTGGCERLGSAVKQLESSVTAADLLVLDQRVQALLRKDFRALVQVCTASSTVIRNVAPAMQQEAEAFLAARLGDVSVTDMYLAQVARAAEGAPPDGPVQQDLVRNFDLADTDLAVASAKEICVLAVPPGPNEPRLRDLAKAALPDVSLIPTASNDEILLYREQVGFALADLKQLGAAGREACQQMAARQHFTSHSRTDITEWRGAVPAAGS